jgi:hypothetical protein
MAVGKTTSVIKCSYDLTLGIKCFFGYFKLFTWNIDLVCGLGCRSGWYLKINKCHYVYDMFGHGKVITQPQALN